MAEGWKTSTRSLGLSGQLPVDDIPVELYAKNWQKINVDSKSLLGTQTTTSWRTDGREQDDSVISRDTVKAMVQSSTDHFNMPYDTGHEFSTVKEFKHFSHPDFAYRDDIYRARFRGPIRVNRTEALPVLPPIDKNYYGNKAIATLAPTAPGATLLQDVAEILKDGFVLTGGSGLADWLKSRTSLARAAGGEYLNVAFGWMPTLSALNRTIVSLQNATKQMTQLRQDSTLWVRRRMEFPEILSSTSFVDVVPKINVGTWTGSNIDGSYWNFFYDGGNSERVGTVTTTVTTNRKVWFSGAFSYYLNPGSNLLDRMDRYMQLSKKVLGPGLTPETLWQLAPWSWLVDWFVDVQSALKAATLLQNDGLVLKYCYLMCRDIVSTEASTTVRFNGLSPVPFSTSQIQISKKRYKGTPFGFGLNPNSFTERQWAILAALGLSRGGKALWL